MFTSPIVLDSSIMVPKIENCADSPISENPATKLKQIAKVTPIKKFFLRFNIDWEKINLIFPTNDAIKCLFFISIRILVKYFGNIGIYSIFQWKNHKTSN